MKYLSVVIPVWNEEKNIHLLLKQLDHVLAAAHITYEIIVIDDHSTDSSWKILTKEQEKYPLRLFQKQGSKGKTQSLLEGFAKARYQSICMIDADLQYSPTFIPAMLDKLSECDIVVAYRSTYQAGSLRRLSSRVFSFVFGKLLHGLECDVQSGLKVFRKEIIERVQISPSVWSFDLEFLVNARVAGYTIGSVPIVFEKRLRGSSKVSLFKTAYELGKRAVLLKIFSPEYIAFHPDTAKVKGKGFHYKGNEFVSHTDLSLQESAVYRLSSAQILVGISLLLLIVSTAAFNFLQVAVILMSLLSLLYFGDLLFNLYLIYRSLFYEPELTVRPGELKKIVDRDLPTYTIFCPLYKEWQVVPQFIHAIEQLDYPKEKLQVMLLLEEDDTETIAQIKRYQLPSYFETRVIPHSLPKTKPKALNFGLQYATGEYTVIFDAEDVPDTDQLKKAVIDFSKAGEDVVCIQAKLNFYNSEQNLLTRLFTAEYSLWFDLVLTGLQAIQAPVPLGGTSNHFRTKDIRMLSGWDPFNVTEDADLGMRIVKRGFTTAIMNSTTIEEANSDVKNWLRQRSRWIKGYIQTYFVHMRRPQEFMQQWRRPHVITFQLVIGGKILSLLINPVMWCMTITYFALRPWIGIQIESLFPYPIFYIAMLSLVVGNFLYVYYYMLGCTKRNQWELIPYMFLIPFYWLLMSTAGLLAVWEFIVRPHYWQKTQHGLHLADSTPTKPEWPEFKPQEELVFLPA